MAEYNKKVLIPTSGLGSRLGDLTKYTNKALVKIGNKAAISHIIDIYPDADFVVTLGHFGDHVKQFLSLSYPNRKFEFVEVENFSGPGSGLLKSISHAAPLLQCPFVFHVCDTLIPIQVPMDLSNNWMACVKSDRSDFFRTVRVSNSDIIRINEKGEMNYDYAYVGVAGIKDYTLFWEILFELLNQDKNDSSDCHVFSKMLEYNEIKCVVLDKHNDTGSVENLIEARKAYKSTYNVLDKPEESIYFLGDSVVKFFSDTTLCRNRVNRAKSLQGLIPNIEGSSNNFYKYKLASGTLLADVISEDKIESFISWAEVNLWKPISVDAQKFSDTCFNFYLNKTKGRLDKYFSLFELEDSSDIINDKAVPSCKDLLDMVDWSSLCNSIPVRFHGDMISDNILYDSGNFTLLDWRQDFAGDLEAGDLYYDLAKFNHNLVINHDILARDLFTVKSKHGAVYCDILRSHNTVLCQKSFLDLLDKKGYNTNKVKILTAIIWLNMAPLHVYPLNKFLFYFGKYNLWRALNA